MIKLIIGFVALLILLAASYIIFVDSSKQYNKHNNSKEHFYPQVPNYGDNKKCNEFKQNSRSFIENNHNFSSLRDESTEINESMKRRYNNMYNRCYNTTHENSCKNNYIGTIPPTFNNSFGEKIINCISDSSCDIQKVNETCVKKGVDCGTYYDNEKCNKLKHCVYEDDVCNFKGNVCNKHNNDEIKCNSEEFCVYNLNSNLCNDKQSCYNYSDKDSCDNISSCKWNGLTCDYNTVTHCPDISIDNCLSHSQCSLMPLNEAEAVCVPN